MLQGQTKLELFRNGQIVHREEKHNAITPWVSNALNQGNFGMIMNKYSALPIKNWFNGCLLTDKDNDPNISMIAHDSLVTAQASNNAYTGTNLRRGSFNTNESGEITGGYRYVWDWTTSQGNGTIKSICLTRPSIGATDITTSGSSPDSRCTEFLNLNGASGEANPWGRFENGTFSILDYDNERAYHFYYEGEKIKVIEYTMNTWRYHVLGDALGAITKTVHEVTIPSPISNYNAYRASVSYDGSYFYYIFSVEGTSVVDVWKIDPSDWTCAYTRHTYAGVATRQHYYSYGTPGNVNLVRNGYIWLMSYDTTKMYKCSLTNDADITEYSLPNPGSSDTRMNGVTMSLPNGDFYKFYVSYGDVYALYYHNDTFYDATAYYYGDNWNMEYGRPFSNSYGTVVVDKQGNSSSGNFLWYLLAIYPYVSTVNNLQNAVTKTYDLTMKLTYTISEGS